ncbi:hypothetical protein [Sphingomonas panni]|uniref:hypothetical protein n=1 Tax=Sphingomonas panni TaxID=237612 RepID=UPI001F5BFBA6|nr:hypothetical protein [Sphingomonas panni]
MANHNVRELLSPKREDVSEQDMAAFDGDCAAVIAAMKLRARCETDGELADFLHKTRSSVAQWRRRRAVPESAVLRLLILLKRDCDA